MTTERLELRYVPLETLRRWDRNAKRHDLGALAESITRHGFRDPPAFDAALNGGEGGIVEGNGRGDALSAMQAQGRPAPRGVMVDEGVWLVPVLFGLDAASQAAAESYGVDHNNLTLTGGDYTAEDLARLWEPAGYADLLADLARSDALPVSVDGDDLDALLASLAGPPALPDDAPVEVPQDGPTRVQPGEVWRVGRHLVACLDSTDAEAVRRLVARRRVGMVWADPPYAINAVDEATGQTGGLGRPGGGYPFGGTKNDGKSKPIKSKIYAPVIGDSSIDTAVRAATLYLELHGDALHVWWGANNYSHALPPSTCWLVWDKENGTNAFADAELAWCNDESAVRIFRHMWNGMLRASEQGERVHPTQKPIALCAWAFERYGTADDLILDPFLGSGPSIKAAEAMGRTVVGFELSPHYCDHIVAWGEAEGLTVERATDA